MIIYQSQNGSNTERRSPINKEINISFKKLSNNISVYNRRSCSRKKNDNYKRRTINEKNDENDYMEINKSNNNVKVKKPYIVNNQLFKMKFKELLDNNKNKKEKKMFLAETSRCNNINKEKYLSKLFINTINEKYDIINKSEVRENNDVNNNGKNKSKRNKVSRNNINQLEENKKFNKSYIIRNESLINLENELNYEFEIRLLKKKQKELQKANNKLKVRIFNLKSEQNRFMQRSEKENIISMVIETCSKYSEFKQNIINNDKNLPENFPATKIFKNMLLNIMDWKYSYENKVMIEKFILALKSILNINDKEEKHYNNYINKVKLIIETKKFIENSIRGIKSSFENSKILEEYLSGLCKFFNFKNLEQLEDFMKSNFIKYNEEFKEITKLKNIILNNNRNKRKNSSININNKYYGDKKHLMKKNNSELNKSRNFDKAYELSKRNNDDTFDKKLFYTYREFNPNNKKENSYIYQNISNNRNFNSRNLSQNKLDIPNYIKSITMHCLKNVK